MFTYYQYAFTPEELYPMFQDFHNSFIPNYQITRAEIVSIMETMAKKEYIGKERMKEAVLPVIGLQKIQALEQIEFLNKDAMKHDYLFSEEEHQQIFDLMSDGYTTIKFMKLLPYLMVFFIAHLNNSLQKRLKSLNEILNPHQKSSIFQCFERIGYTERDFFMNRITYREIEQVIIDFKTSYPRSFNFDQIETILK